MRGRPASLASITAGYQWAGALPEVASKATGRPLARARPRAKKAALRSSRTGVRVRAGRRCPARTTGVEREPGERTRCLTPPAMSPSSKASAQRKLTQARSGALARLAGSEA